MKLIQMNIQEGRSPNQPQDSDFSSQRQGAKSLVLNKGQVLAENFANIEEIFNVYLGTLTSNKRILKLFGFRGFRKQTNTQTDILLHINNNVEIDRQIPIEIDRQTNTYIDRQKDRQIPVEIDRQINRQIDRQIDR